MHSIKCNIDLQHIASRKNLGLAHRIWKLAASFWTLLFYIFTISFTCKCEDEVNISCLFRVIWVIFSSSFYMENMWNSGCFHVQNLGEIHIYSLSKFHLKFRLDFHMIFMCLNIHDFHMKSTLVVDRGGASFQKHPRGFEQRRKNWFAIKHKCTLMYWVLSVISYKGIDANGKVIQVLNQHFRTAALF